MKPKLHVLCSACKSSSVFVDFAFYTAVCLDCGETEKIPDKLIAKQQKHDATRTVAWRKFCNMKRRYELAKSEISKTQRAAEEVAQRNRQMQQDVAWYQCQIEALETQLRVARNEAGLVIKGAVNAQGVSNNA